MRTLLTEHSSDLADVRALLGLRQRGQKRRRSHVGCLRITRHGEDDMVPHLREQLDQVLQIRCERLPDDRERGATCHYAEARFHRKESSVFYGVRILLRRSYGMVSPRSRGSRGLNTGCQRNAGGSCPGVHNTVEMHFGIFECAEEHAQHALPHRTVHGGTRVYQQLR